MRFLIALVALLITMSGVEAGPVAVRHPEGDVYGVLALRTFGGEVLAHGELIQSVRGHQVASQLAFRFNDGSLFDERVAFTQQKLFSLTSYKFTQRGPALPGSSEVTSQRASGQYHARVREKPDAKEEVLEGRLDMPADVYNGMSSVLLKNLKAEETATGRLLAFTPKPRLLAMKLSAEATDDLHVGSATRKATRWLVNLELGGMLGVGLHRGQGPARLALLDRGGAPAAGFREVRGTVLSQWPGLAHRALRPAVAGGESAPVTCRLTRGWMGANAEIEMA